MPGLAVARADPWKTGWACFKFAKFLYIMPLLFAYTHILFDGSLLQNLLSVLTAVVGTFIFSIVTMGHFLRKTTWIEWSILAVATFLAYIYNIYTFAIAIGTIHYCLFCSETSVKFIGTLECSLFPSFLA